MEPVGLVAVVVGVGGVVAALAGLVGLWELTRVRRAGVVVPALVRERARGPEDRSAVVRPLLQFATEDGRVVEVFSPVPSTPRRPLVDGSQVAVRYDPTDPRRVVLADRERRPLEYAFLGLGAALLCAAVLLAALV
ncbi:DUF3592 domain-containing protein [Kitasatospora sp. NPDC093806]|uniref:DUF3592 domain-containing protein n=1 Tax=Kitasatospora sp. NPDC093806 TaxID=3155075 RepID=UPI00341774C8